MYAKGKSFDLPFFYLSIEKENALAVLYLQKLINQ